MRSRWQMAAAGAAVGWAGSAATTGVLLCIGGLWAGAPPQAVLFFVLLYAVPVAFAGLFGLLPGLLGALVLAGTEAPTTPHERARAGWLAGVSAASGVLCELFGLFVVLHLPPEQPLVAVPACTMVTVAVLGGRLLGPRLADRRWAARLTPDRIPNWRPPYGLA
ncbi:hypothetical protein [Kitasatospora sp. LaBMicrA B282]|uniref:hypothetical protein n=1 Tax=Kitasatospora sp. LaBMicrA B282 TaxID=3420949 RepID=UPI003D0CEA76